MRYGESSSYVAPPHRVKEMLFGKIAGGIEIHTVTPEHPWFFNRHEISLLLQTAILYYAMSCREGKVFSEIACDHGFALCLADAVDVICRHRVVLRAEELERQDVLCPADLLERLQDAVEVDAAITRPDAVVIAQAPYWKSSVS